MTLKEILSRIDSIEGWLSEEVITTFFKLIKSSDPKIILEIGAWKGKSSVVFGLSSNARAKVFSLDPFTGSQEHKHLYGENLDTFDEYKQNIKRNKLENKVIPIIGKTGTLTKSQLKIFQESGIDFLFIDGSHEYEDVLNDFKFWSPYLNQNSIIAFHDYKWPGVKKVIWEEFFEDPRFGKITRVEDTFISKTIKKPSVTDKLYNDFYLRYLKINQKLKRKKRKLRKKLKKIGLNSNL